MTYIHNIESICAFKSSVQKDFYLEILSFIRSISVLSPLKSQFLPYVHISPHFKIFLHILHIFKFESFKMFFKF